jgi:ABC-type antimicrobial peptide transport system permease subunit
MIIGQAARLAGIGIVIGIAAAALLSPFLDSLLYGVKAADPITFVMVPATLLAVAALAALVPARKAMRIDPIAALRIE